MLTRLAVRNFKRLKDVEIELGNPVVFVGPNDSGKTSALQALALWDLGLRTWVERRRESAPEQRSGVVINRRDPAAIPNTSARQMWRELEVRRTWREPSGQRTENIRIDIVVDGDETGLAAVPRAEASPKSESSASSSDNRQDGRWTCGLEFDFTNAESFYCRLLRTSDDGAERMQVPDAALRTGVVLLPPMSGLVANETRLDPGAVNVRLGEGRTAEVMRNLCLQVHEQSNGADRWRRIAEQIERHFGARLDDPARVVQRGEIELTYRTRNESRLDITASGRGMQQMLLLLTFIELHSGSVVLLDEPDAHLEILRQRQMFNLLTETAAQRGTQLVIASHSEVVLSEAAERGTVVAFVGSPHRMKKAGDVRKALGDIGFVDYYQAEAAGLVLYLEGETDLSCLQAYARRIGHPVEGILDTTFVHYVGNRTDAVQRHFYGLREAKDNLIGFALFDRLEGQLPQSTSALVFKMWTRREIENYLLPARSLLRYVESLAADRFAPGQLFSGTQREQWDDTMRRILEDRVPPAALRNDDDPFWVNTKISDEFLDPVIDAFCSEVGVRNFMHKSDYHRLVSHLDPDEVCAEVISVLDAVAAQHARAMPATG